MQLTFNTSANDPASALVRGVSQTTPANYPVFTLGDNPSLDLYLADGQGGYDAASGTTGYVPWLGIGTPGALPTSGTFYLGVSSATSGTITSGKRYLISTFVAGDDFTNVGGTNLTGSVFTATGTTPTTWTNASELREITADISATAAASAIQSALNATAAIGANGVTVTASSSASLAFVIDWAAVGTRYLTVGYGGSMTPDAAAIITQLVAGTSVVKERQFLRLVANPAALQTTWTQITNGWNARLSCATRGLVDLLNSAKSVDSYLELQIIDGSGNISTVGQVKCTIRNEVVDPAALIPVPLPSYLNAAQIQLGYIANRYTVTGLTGGGTNLDGLATGTTANPTIQTSAVVEIDLSGVLYFYKLVTGTDAESSPSVIRPDDYDGTTNARVWKLRNALIAAHHTTHENGGSDEISVAGLSGLLADGQTPLAHATSHKSGGSDSIKLDELAAPTDVTTLNASASRHGLLRKLDGVTTHFLRGDGSWSIPAPYQLYVENPFSPTTPVATGNNGVSIGSGASSGNGGGGPYWDGIAIGTGAGAPFERGVAIGYGAYAAGNYAVAIGPNNTSSSAVASSLCAIAIGSNSSASGSYSLAIGNTAAASGANSVAFTGGTASGVFSFAGPGNSNTAAFAYSSAFGYSSAPVIEGHFAHSGNTGSQHGWIHTTFQTTNNTPAEVLFGHSIDQRLPLANNKAYRYRAQFLFRDATSGNITSIVLTGVVKRGANAAATSLIYDLKDVEVNEDGAFDSAASADTTNGTVKFTVTGHATHVVNICVAVYLCEIL